MKNSKEISIGLTRKDIEILKAIGVNEHILNFINSDGKLHLVRSPAGSGKTRTALAYSYLLAIKGFRVAIFYRTISEIEHAMRIIKEMEDTVKTFRESRILVIPLVGKEKMCLFTPNEKDLLKWWCTILSCYFLKKRRSRDLESNLREITFSSINMYYEMAKSLDLCPYFAYQELAKKADIVLATHAYFIDSNQFEKIGQVDVVIIDEAHNIFITKTGEISKNDFIGGEKILEMFSPTTNRDDMIAKSLWETGDKKLAVKYAKYKNFIEAEGIKIEIGNKIVKILPPKMLYSRRLEKVGKIIATSGTLYPMNLFKKILEGNEFESKVLIIKGLIEGHMKRLIIGFKTGLTTKKTERTLKTFKRYSDLVKIINLEIGEPVLVFTPNKTIAEKISEITNGIYIESEKDVIGLHMRGGCDHVIYVTYARSPISEGIDLKLDPCNPRVIIMIGLPYPNIDYETRKILELYEDYYSLRRGSLVNAYRTTEMISSLIQSLGRVGRREKGAAIVIDDRLTKYELFIKIFDDLRRLIKTVKGFLK